MSYNVIRPRRGIKSMWDTYKGRVYKLGEMLVESPETGVGTGPVNIKFGDGVSSYENLPYAVMAPTDELTEGGKAPMTAGAGYALKKLIGEGGSGGDATTVGGFPLAIDGKRGLVTINTDYGVMEVGQYIDFHKFASDGDFTQRLYVDTVNEDKLSIWGKGAVATAADLANYLPLTGGTLKNALSLNDGWANIGGEPNSAYLIASDTQGDLANTRMLIMFNKNYMGDTANALQIWEKTNGLASAQHTVLHTGNIGQHAIARNGGSAVDSINVMSVNHTNDTSHTRVICNNSGVSYLVNALPDYSVVRQISIEPKNITDNPNDALKYQYTEDGSTWYNVAIHHDLNSAKLLISNTPLTAEGSVRVW